MIRGLTNERMDIIANRSDIHFLSMTEYERRIGIGICIRIAVIRIERGIICVD